jgi:hypothetical protein
VFVVNAAVVVVFGDLVDASTYRWFVLSFISMSKKEKEKNSKKTLNRLVSK